jgi:HEAT repeat protein
VDEDTSIAGRFRRFAARAGQIFRSSTSRAAAAGRAAAARVLPMEEPPAATDRLLALVPRISTLATRPDLPRALADRVTDVDQALRSALATAETLRAMPEEAPPPLDRRHPLAAAARQALARVDAAPVEVQAVARRAVHALMHPSAAVRRLALQELMRHRAPALIPLLQALYRRAAAPERQAVLVALRALGATAAAAAPSARAAADDEGPAPPARPAASATRPRDNAAAARRRDALETALADPDPTVRLAAVRGATERPGPALVLPLLRALLDPDLELRKAAVRAISTIVGFDITFDAYADDAARRGAVAALRRWWAQARFEELAGGVAPHVEKGPPR